MAPSEPAVAGDVVIFEPERVACSPLRRVRDLPGDAESLVSDAAGIRAVVVEGTLLARRGATRWTPRARSPDACCAGRAPRPSGAAQALPSGQPAGRPELRT